MACFTRLNICKAVVSIGGIAYVIKESIGIAGCVNYVVWHLNGCSIGRSEHRLPRNLEVAFHSAKLHSSGSLQLVFLHDNEGGIHTLIVQDTGIHREFEVIDSGFIELIAPVAAGGIDHTVITQIPLHGGKGIIVTDRGVGKLHHGSRQDKPVAGLDYRLMQIGIGADVRDGSIAIQRLIRRTGIDTGAERRSE